MENPKLFRSTLIKTKGQAAPRSRSNEPKPPNKPTPPDQTDAENFYWVKQMEAHTPVTVALTNGEELHGMIEWYDPDCVKLTRVGSPNLLIYKRVIKFLYKEGKEAVKGGSDGPGRPQSAPVGRQSCGF